MNLSFFSLVNRTDWTLLPRGGKESKRRKTMNLKPTWRWISQAIFLKIHHCHNCDIMDGAPVTIIVSETHDIGLKKQLYTFENASKIQVYSFIYFYLFSKIQKLSMCVLSEYDSYVEAWNILSWIFKSFKCLFWVSTGKYCQTQKIKFNSSWKQNNKMYILLTNKLQSAKMLPFLSSMPGCIAHIFWTLQFCLIYLAFNTGQQRIFFSAPQTNDAVLTKIKNADSKFVLRSLLEFYVLKIKI